MVCATLPLLACARTPEPPFPDSIQLEPGAVSLIKLGEYRYVYRMFFKLYDAALFIDADADADAEDILAASTRYRLQFRYLRKIDKSIILESSAKMLEKNLSQSELAQISDRIDQINEAYRTVQSGDRSSLTYQPGIGTTLRINGTAITTVEGDDFARLYFKIWLGDQPISVTLRDELLGRR